MANNSHTIYKPNNKGTGAASNWQLSKKGEEYQAFLEISAQLPDKDENNNARFDWQKKLIVKLGMNDLGDMIDALTSRAEAKLFHQTPGGNKIIQLTYSEQYNNFYLSVSAQDANKNSLGKFSHSLTMGEAAVLNVLLRHAAVKMAGWH